MAKFQDKENLKGGKRQTGSNIQVSPIRLTADFSTETQDNMKCNNIHIIGIPEGEEEEQG